MFSKVNFIVPVGTDVTLKLRNSKGMVAHIIRDYSCSIVQAGTVLYVKQEAESNQIALDFQSAAEATVAHTLLRDALMQLGININNTVPAAESAVTTMSTDFKNEKAQVTVYDGDDAGISGLADQAVGPVCIEVNGQSAFIGDGCTDASFDSPDWDGLFAKRYDVTAHTSSTLTLSSAGGIEVNEYVIVQQTALNHCYKVTAVNTGTNVITLNTSSISGTVAKMYKVKKWNNTEVGDSLLWFGSSANYQLGVKDVIIYKYFKGASLAANAINAPKPQRTLFNFITDVALAAVTTEQDVFNYTVPANTLFVDGDKINAEYALQIKASGGITKRIRVRFAGTVIFDTGAMNIAANTDMRVKMIIIRDSLTTVRCLVTNNTNTLNADEFAKVTKVTGIALNVATTLIVTGAVGMGVAVGDITGVLGNIILEPAA